MSKLSEEILLFFLFGSVFGVSPGLYQPVRSLSSGEDIGEAAANTRCCCPIFEKRKKREKRKEKETHVLRRLYWCGPASTLYLSTGTCCRSQTGR